MTEIKSEMTGTVLKVVVSVGDQVNEDDTIIILESMKMEIPIDSPQAGIVQEIKVQERDIVKEDQVIAILS